MFYLSINVFVIVHACSVCVLYSISINEYDEHTNANNIGRRRNFTRSYTSKTSRNELTVGDVVCEKKVLDRWKQSTALFSTKQPTRVEKVSDCSYSACSRSI